MSTETKGYYHCLECGALFEAAIKEPEDQRCPICGNPPTGKILAGTEQDRYATTDANPEVVGPRPSGKLHGINHDTQDIYEATIATMDAQKESRSGRVTRTKRRNKKGSKRWVFVGLWVVLMALVVGLVKYFEPEEDSDSAVPVVDATEQERMTAAEQKRRALILESALPACRDSMIEFLNASSAASKAQYVYQGVKLSGVMNRYYQDALSFSSSKNAVQIVRAELLEGFPKRVIGAVCQNQRGQRWEAVFISDGNEWKIDWASLIRYDDRSWSMFPAGKQGEEGEFRLYMRVRDSNEDFERKEMSLVFYKPTMYFKDEFRGVASSPVSVLIDSELGRAIEALVQKEDELGRNEVRLDEFGYSIGMVDPGRYHRVRVKMKVHREGKDGKDTRLELLEILANHWYGIEASPKNETPAED